MNVRYNLISDLPVFLAYSLELEREAAERLRLYAAMMKTRDQHHLAQTFTQLATFSEEHAGEVEAICRKRGIPLSAAQTSHQEKDAPETLHFEDTGTTVTAREAVESMLVQEQASADFYAEVAMRTINPEIRKFALDFAEEERRHARALEEWLNGSATAS